MAGRAPHPRSPPPPLTPHWSLYGVLTRRSPSSTSPSPSGLYSFPSFGWQKGRLKYWYVSLRGEWAQEGRAGAAWWHQAAVLAANRHMRGRGHSQQ